MFSKILVPFDVRFIPKMTLRAAAALAHDGAEVTFLHVTGAPCDFVDPPFSVVDEDEMERCHYRMKRTIENVLAIFSEYGGAGTMLVVRSRPVHTAINRVARRIMADAILMGTHGRRGLSRTLYGSVTEHVVRQADVPVIVIRESSRKLFLPLFQDEPRPV